MSLRAIITLSAACRRISGEPASVAAIASSSM
jgi:hypothetical protein